MTAEQHFFIQILTDHVHGRPSVPETDSLNWEKVYYYAQEQALPGLVYVQTKDFFKASLPFDKIVFIILFSDVFTQ